MEKNLMEAVKKICKLLERKRISWVIVGSTSLVLQGVEIRPKDIDILTTKEGAYKIGEILKRYEVKPVKFSRSKIFSSHFGKFRIDGIKVEVMGDLKAKIKGKWTSLAWRIKRRVFFKVGNLKVPMPRLEDQLEVYSKINRKKNVEKVKKIKEFLKKKNSNEL